MAAIQKSLQRLVKRGLVKEQKEEGRHGKKTYQAVLARGEVEEECPPKEKPCTGTDPRVDTGAKNTEVSTLESGGDAKGGHTGADLGVCPPSDPCPDADSALGGHSGQYPRARGDGRTKAESDALRDKAWGQWDV